LGYIETILEPGERITYRAYLHWIIYVRPGWVMLIGVLLILYAANTVTGDQVNWPPFRPDSRHNLEGLRLCSSTGLCLTIINELN
jgi:hypothetical protein